MGVKCAWLGRVMRGRRLDGNPLRRRSDRVETVLLAALLAAFVGGAPVAAHTAAALATATSQQELRAQHADLHRVTAVLLDAPATGLTFGGGYVAPQAIARWRAPDGHAVTGMISTPAGAKAGSALTIWTNPHGQFVTPLQRDEVALRADLAATVAVAALGVLLLVTATIACRMMHRRRMAAWDADWQATGPRWSSRR